MMLVDTGPLVALFDPRDGQHQRCVKTLKSVRELAAHDRGAGADRSLSYARSGQHRLRSIAGIHPEGWHVGLVVRSRITRPRVRADGTHNPTVPWIPADASLIVAARKAGVRTVFTVDRKDFAAHVFPRPMALHPGDRSVKHFILHLRIVGAAFFAPAPWRRRSATPAPDGKLRVALAQQPFSPNGTSPGPRTMAERRGSAGARRARRDRSRQEAALTADENTGARRLEAARHGARPLRRSRRRQRTRRLLHVSASTRRVRRCRAWSPGAAAFRADARADPDRDAVARRASRLQHAGDDAQRIARRDAGGGRHRPRAAAACGSTRTSIRRSPIGTSSWAACGSIDPLEQQLLDDSRIEQLTRRRPAPRDAGRLRAARSAESR